MAAELLEAKNLGKVLVQKNEEKAISRLRAHISAGGTIDVQTLAYSNSTMNALHRTANRAKFHVLQWLLRNALPANQIENQTCLDKPSTHENLCGYTVLHTVIDKIHSLIKKKQHATTTKDTTAFDEQIQHARSIVKQLLDLGANIDAQTASNKFLADNFDHNTPLHLAVKTGDEVLIRILTEASANSLIQNADKETATDLANQIPNEGVKSNVVSTIKTARNRGMGAWGSSQLTSRRGDHSPSRFDDAEGLSTNADVSHAVISDRGTRTSSPVASPVAAAGNNASANRTLPPDAPVQPSTDAVATTTTTSSTTSYAVVTNGTGGGAAVVTVKNEDEEQHSGSALPAQQHQQLPASAPASQGEADVNTPLMASSHNATNGDGGYGTPTSHQTTAEPQVTDDGKGCCCAVM